jgi:uracil-DNA glycosylase family 4
VGEAPGEDEVLAGVPLVGPSGRLFNALLRTANIDRRECLVTNVFDTRAPDNDPRAAGWLKDKERVNASLARLESEISTYHPTIIVPLGGTALWAFTGADNITAFRGHAARSTVVARGTKILPTPHPAHVLRNYKLYSIVVNDIIKAAAEAERGPEVYTPKRRILIDPTIRDLFALTSSIMRCPLLSVDIETAWGQITHVGLAWEEESAVCIPFVDLRRPNRQYWARYKEEVCVWEWLKFILHSPVPKLGQNFASFDAMWLYVKYGIEVRNLQHDTRLLHHALYPELEKSLEFMGAAYSEQGAWKHLGRRGGESVEKRDS